MNPASATINSRTSVSVPAGCNESHGRDFPSVPAVSALSAGSSYPRDSHHVAYVEISYPQAGFFNHPHHWCPGTIGKDGGTTLPSTSSMSVWTDPAGQNAYKYFSFRRVLEWGIPATQEEYRFSDRSYVPLRTIAFIRISSITCRPQSMIRFGRDGFNVAPRHEKRSV